MWVFGDSFATPDCFVPVRHSFWMLTAQKLAVKKIYNYARGGNSFESVVHALVCDSAEIDWKDDFIIVGIPALARSAVVSKDDGYSNHRQVFDTGSEKITEEMILALHGIESKSFYHDPTAIRFEDPQWTEIQALRIVFLLNAWLDAQKANYLICNLGKDFIDAVPATGKFLMETCYKHPNNLVNGDTYYGVNVGVNKPVDFDKHGWAGHHGPAGNKRYFESAIYPRLLKNNLL